MMMTIRRFLIRLGFALVLILPIAAQAGPSPIVLSCAPYSSPMEPGTVGDYCDLGCFPTKGVCDASGNCVGSCPR
jgi:hypothetical protein